MIVAYQKEKRIKKLLLIALLFSNVYGANLFEVSDGFKCGSVSTVRLPELMSAMGGDGVIADFDSNSFKINFIDLVRGNFWLLPEINIDGAASKYYVEESDKPIIGYRDSFAFYRSTSTPLRGTKISDNQYEFEIPLNFKAFKHDQSYFYSELSGLDIENNINSLKTKCKYILKVPSRVEDTEFEAELIERCSAEEDYSSTLQCSLD
jgi:hypothetical protein